MSRTRDRAIVMGLSVAAHLIVLGWLMTRRHILPSASETPAMQVLLAPSILRRLPLEARRSAEPRTRPHAADAPGRALVRRQDPNMAASPRPGEPDAVAPAPADLRRALHGLLGCRMADQTDDERRRCERRLAARDDRPAPRLNLDVRGDFGLDGDPYLARRPKNGCKLRAGGDSDPAGEQGPALGVGCAWGF